MDRNTLISEGNQNISSFRLTKNTFKPKLFAFRLSRINNDWESLMFFLTFKHIHRQINIFWAFDISLSKTVLDKNQFRSIKSHKINDKAYPWLCRLVRRSLIKCLIVQLGFKNNYYSIFLFRFLEGKSHLAWTGINNWVTLVVKKCTGNLGMGGVLQLDVDRLRLKSKLQRYISDFGSL
jgi:hypothetical protein